VKARPPALVRQAEPRPHTVVLELGESPDLDVQAVDTLGELADALARDGIQLQLASVRALALRMLERAGVAERVTIASTVDAAVRAP
jgi:MFS superfamily sulfate permease-like transporter